ncbi:MAG: VCBS repeat-containing protein, partial [Planctomycetota bacterium]|nr:VCBS repeat-containing protein [Planctomycetota bacterium]
MDGQFSMGAYGDPGRWSLLTLLVGLALTATLTLLLFLPLPAQSEKNLFEEVSSSLGLDKLAAKRVVFVDVNGDGWLDVFLLAESSLSLFLNLSDNAGRRRLQDFTVESGLKAADARLPNFLIFADVDNDGDKDCFLSRYNDFLSSGKPDDGFRCEILLNDGKGHFKKATSSGVDKYSETTTAASFLDYDNDGVLDLFVGNFYKLYGKSLECYPSRLYKGDGKGSFKEVTENVGLLTQDEPGKRESSRPVYGVTHLDYNNDGYQDILVCAYGRQWNILWENRKGGQFKD